MGGFGGKSIVYGVEGSIKMYSTMVSLIGTTTPRF
jgi:hypothetical protein